MKRRSLLKMLTTATASGAALRAGSAAAQSDDTLLEDVDPYFLDAGELTDSEQEALIAIEELQEQQLQGRQVVIPRGLRPSRAPTFRFVHWDGDIGDPSGRFISPLSVTPQTDELPSYQVNGQILGFRGASEDWRGRSNQGTLTVELRTRASGEPMTWFFAQQFDVDAEGFGNLSYEYLAQRDGSPEPAVTDQPNIGLRIQLMRSPRRAGQILRRFLGMFLALTGGLPVGNQRNRIAVPPVRVPAMLREGAALAQALIGGTAEETPIWRGGFSSYSIAAGGSRLSLVPGYWMAIDAGREPDLRGVILDDLGGLVAPTREGERLDANYVVFGFEIGEGPFPPYLRSRSPIIPKSV